MVKLPLRSSAKLNPKAFYGFQVNSIDGQPLDMNQFKDKVVIAVNVASKCGYTGSNYRELSQLLDKYYERGLRVLLFPCNQFMNQESGDACSIKAMSDGYNPRFIMTEKIKVNGSDAHPVYKWMKEKAGGFLVNAIKWNFSKFLINKQGEVHPTRFSHLDSPLSMEPTIQKLLNE